MMQACIMVKVFAPTEVPNALPTSLAPVPQPKPNAPSAPYTTIQVNCPSIGFRLPLVLLVLVLVLVLVLPVLLAGVAGLDACAASYLCVCM